MLRERDSRRRFYQAASFRKTLGKHMRRTPKILRLPLQIGLLAASLALAVFALPQSPCIPGKLEEPGSLDEAVALKNVGPFRREAHEPGA
jgi:hypothetical protein